MNKKTILSLTIAILVTACGAGSGDGLDKNGRPITSSSSSSSVASSDGSNNSSSEPSNDNGATLAKVQEEVFGAICILCHVGGAAPLGLRLDSEDNSFNFLVGVASIEQSTLQRVNPGNPDESYIVHKVEGRAGIGGGQMPLGLTPLSDDNIQLIRDWIANGAPRTGTGTASTKITMVNQKINHSGNLQFNFHFSRNINATDERQVQVYFNANDYRYLAGKADYTTTLNQDSITVELTSNASKHNLSALEIVINDPATGGILDVNGRLIDGNNDQIDGGTFSHVYHF